MPRSKTGRRIAALEEEIESVEDELERIQREEDSSRAETQIRVAGLTCKMWALRRRSCRLRGDMRSEVAADHRHHEWETQFARLAAKVELDRHGEVLDALKRQDELASGLGALQ